MSFMCVPTITITQLAAHCGFFVDNSNCLRNNANRGGENHQTDTKIRQSKSVD